MWHFIQRQVNMDAAALALLFVYNSPLSFIHQHYFKNHDYIIEDLDEFILDLQ